MHLGLGYIAAFAREHHSDLKFTILDTRIATRKETNAFFQTPFDLIGMTVLSPIYFETIEIFKRIKNGGNIPVVLGGPYVTTIMGEIFEETPAEYAIYGEGEITFSEFLHFLKGKGNLKDIDGLMYKTETGKIITNPPRKQIRDLDSLPIPAYDLFQMDRYPLHRIVTSRGCPYMCAYCNATFMWGQNWRKREAKNLVDEIEFLIKNHGKKIMVFADNSFNIDLKRVEEFCDLLIKNKTRVLWSTSVRADIITQPIANKMKKAGCYNVAVGIESANNEMLARMNKGTNIEKVTEGIRIFKKAGIEVLGQFVMGTPGETLQTVKESLEYAKKSECDYINFYAILPFKGTPQWDYVLKEGKITTTKIHDFHSINPRIVFETPEFPYADRLKAIKLVKRAGFYSNQDKKNWWFDVAKETSRKIQAILPEATGEKLFMILKSIYKIRFIKKNNR
jgi:radical SAM superfamily enzyme YgiQ (UPF0313 family)